ncbi:ABC transporter ATP-binding protein [Muricomes intestini]|uniref:ABC transporter ATP-binding protein n=1 Tax=Muricomes intestini TaxID=1796634 RepID=UPI002FDB6AE2
MGKMKVLEVKDLIRNYPKQSAAGSKDDIKVLKGLSFQVEKGEFLGVMGKSGCGKTTLLKVLGLIDRQTDGALKFMEKGTDGLHPDELADLRRKQIGFVFQDFYLMDSLSVKENIMLPMILDKEKSEIMSEKTRELAEQFQIDSLLEKDPYELSGGEKQRVAICRALINNPDVILADEPTGNLDTKSGKIVIDALMQINREYGKTVIMVTHDPKMASHCGKIILLKDGVILETLRKTGTDEAFYHLTLEKMERL